MARTAAALWDWHVFSRAADMPWRWTRFPLELGPELIVTPHLYDWPGGAPSGRDVYTCAGAPEVAVFCARDDHRAFVAEEVVPRVHLHVRNVALVEPDHDRVTWAGSGRSSTLAELAPALEAAWGGRGPPLPEFRRLAATEDRERDWFCDDDAPLPEADDHPIRLWEALFWRGHTWRYELVAGEVPLVGDLRTPTAAAATLDQLAEDAARLVGEPAREDAGWTRCGPFRLRRQDRQVELHVRLSPADVRAAFMPQARRPGDDALPTLIGVLLAGGDNGKTELLDGWTWATAITDSPADALRLAAALAPVVPEWTGAPARIGARPERGEDPVWVLSPHDRYLTVWVPMMRDDLLPWRVMSG